MLKDEIKTVLIRIEKLILPVLESMELELVDINYLQDGAYWFLRIYIENLNGEITLDHCAKISDKISDDVDKMIEDKFFLEVSSPGLNRVIKKERDFIRFTGEKVKLILKRKYEDSRNWSGKLIKFEKGIVYLDIDSKILQIEFSDIKKANIVFEYNE